jgi:hypothetical protein
MRLPAVRKAPCFIGGNERCALAPRALNRGSHCSQRPQRVCRHLPSLARQKPLLLTRAAARFAPLCVLARPQDCLAADQVGLDCARVTSLPASSAPLDRGPAADDPTAAGSGSSCRFSQQPMQQPTI